MAYITTANQRSIIWKIDFDKFNPVGEIYKSKISFFSHFEVKFLLAMLEMIKEPEKFITTYYNKPVQEDTFQLMNETKSPAYHSDKYCPFLNAKFEEYKVPEEVINRGVNEVIKFRKWYEENKNLPEELFEMRCQHAFRLTFKYEKIVIKNSGRVEFENHSLKDVEDEIDRLLKDANTYLHQSRKTEIILNKLQKCYRKTIEEKKFDNNTGFNINEVQQIALEYHDKFKAPINNLLLEWYKMRFNPNLDFESKILDELGFLKCKNCYDKNYISPSSPEYLNDLPF